MSKQANKTVIGLFVLGAIVLAVGALIIFGSGQIFTQVSEFVLYFPGSVKGLNVGAPVVFRGVKIGAVTRIQARVMDYETFDIYYRRSRNNCIRRIPYNRIISGKPPRNYYQLSGHKCHYIHI